MLQYSFAALNHYGGLSIPQRKIRIMKGKLEID